MQWLASTDAPTIGDHPLTSREDECLLALLKGRDLRDVIYTNTGGSSTWEGNSTDEWMLLYAYTFTNPVLANLVPACGKTQG
jgi:hypothetical protein